MLSGIIGGLERGIKMDAVKRILRVTVLDGFTSLAIVREFNHQSGRLKMYKYRGCLQLSS